ITITTLDTSATGEDINLGSTSFVNAKAGNVNLKAGDNIILVGGTINASKNATLTGDVGDADPGVGTLIEVAGTIAAAAVFLNGGSDADPFVVRKVASGSPMTISTVNGADVIYVGSNATSTGNTGGLLSNIAASLTIAGASDGLASLSLDDSGATQARTGSVITSSTVTGFGMTGSVSYSNLASLSVTLGAGADTATVRSTASATTTSL